MLSYDEDKYLRRKVETPRSPGTSAQLNINLRHLGNEVQAKLDGFYGANNKCSLTMTNLLRTDTGDARLIRQAPRRLALAS